MSLNLCACLIAARQEPFSGLCMHPVEHLYYWSCAVIPLMMFPTSPFAMLWVGQHALLAPAASHSGWEVR